MKGIVVCNVTKRCDNHVKALVVLNAISRMSPEIISACSGEDFEGTMHVAGRTYKVPSVKQLPYLAKAIAAISRHPLEGMVQNSTAIPIVGEPTDSYDQEWKLFIIPNKFLSDPDTKRNYPLYHKRLSSDLDRGYISFRNMDKSLVKQYLKWLQPFALPEDVQLDSVTPADNEHSDGYPGSDLNGIDTGLPDNTGIQKQATLRERRSPAADLPSLSTRENAAVAARESARSTTSANTATKNFDFNRNYVSNPSSAECGGSPSVRGAAFSPDSLESPQRPKESPQRPNASTDHAYPRGIPVPQNLERTISDSGDIKSSGNRPPGLKTTHSIIFPVSPAEHEASLATHRNRDFRHAFSPVGDKEVLLRHRKEMMQECKDDLRRLGSASSDISHDRKSHSLESRSLESKHSDMAADSIMSSADTVPAFKAGTGNIVETLRFLRTLVARQVQPDEDPNSLQSRTARRNRQQWLKNLENLISSTDASGNTFKASLNDEVFNGTAASIILRGSAPELDFCRKYIGEMKRKIGGRNLEQPELFVGRYLRLLDAIKKYGTFGNFQHKFLGSNCKLNYSPDDYRADLNNYINNGKLAKVLESSSISSYVKH